MTALVDVRRFLHCNYNCRDIERLERFYAELFGLRAVMRSESTDDDGSAFGIYGPTSSNVSFLYDHRGGKTACSLELVQWTDPATFGSVYPEPWYCGIQAVGYTAADLGATAAAAVALGGSELRRGEGWVLLRDPEGVALEVLQGDGPSEAKYLRVVCSDLERTAAWWGQLGFAEAPLAKVPGAAAWPGDGDHQVSAERGMVGTDDPSFGILLTTWSGPEPKGPTYAMPYHQGLYRMALAVEDVSAAHAALYAADATRQLPNVFHLEGTPLAAGLTIMFLRDPDGILVELVQRPRIGRT